MITRINIKEIAERKGINQKQLIEASGVSTDTILRLWNTPTASTTTATLGRIASALHCNMNELINSIADGDDATPHTDALHPHTTGKQDKRKV